MQYTEPILSAPDAPVTIHQTWGTPQVPYPFSEYRSRLLHATRLWTDEEMWQFVHDRFGAQDATMYSALPLDVHRWDTFRYFLLYAEGGMYLDLDMEQTSSFEPLFAAPLVLCYEHPEDNARLGNPGLLSNAMMIAGAKHPFFQHLLDDIRQNRNIGRTRSGVVNDTGPGLVTRVFNQLQPKALLLPHTAFFPYSVFATDTSAEGQYATHKFAGTWWPQCSDKEII